MLKYGVTALCLAAPLTAYTNGIFRNGVGAESMSLGGTETGWADTPISAMAANPAGLAFLDTAGADFDTVGATPEGHYSKAPYPDGALDSTLRAFPEGAIAYPFQKYPITIGLSFIPEAAMTGDWNYYDAPSVPGGISYGQQEHRSEIELLRTALGAGVQITPKWSFGASVGLLYNHNELETPYIFQNLSPNPNSLNGAKTLLDLRTSGYGGDAQIGLMYRPTANLSFGLAYTCASVLKTTGSANGDPYAQFSASPGQYAFHYNAEVDNTFPQVITLGTAWRFQPKWRLALQLDWINWSGAINSLPVKLSNGNNATVNGALGASFSDSIPMNWSDEFVYRAGLEYDVTERLSLRAGYCYGHSPVPAGTLSPMTAAITENTLTAGIGYHWKHIGFDLAYQYDLPETESVGTSDLKAGEYSNSSTTVAIHWVSLSTSIKF